MTCPAHPLTILCRGRCLNCEKNEAVRRRHAEQKAKALAAYGGRCAECFIKDPDMLTIDHIDNEGAAHRKKIGEGASKLYRWLESHHYPAGYQVLCFNHNIKKYLTWCRSRIAN